LANIKSAKKRARQAIGRRARNMAKRSRMRTSIKKVLAAVAAGDKEAAQSAYQEAVPEIDRMAGRGIVHSEMPEQQDGLLEGFQLWINLPGSHKMTSPAYQEHDEAQIPTETRPGSEIRVITGTTSAGTVGPVVQPLTDPLYLDVALKPETVFDEVIAQVEAGGGIIAQAGVPATTPLPAPATPR